MSPYHHLLDLLSFSPFFFICYPVLVFWMIKVDAPTPPLESANNPSLADLSRNASVISSSSGSSSASSLALKSSRPRPVRTFSSPRSCSPGGPTTPRTTRPPAYLTKELGIIDNHPELLGDRKYSARAQSKSKSRNNSVNGRLSAEDFEFGEILGEGSYSTVSVLTSLRHGFLLNIGFAGLACNASCYATGVCDQSAR